MTILVDGRLSEKDPSCSTRVMQLKEKKQDAVEPFASHPTDVWPPCTVLDISTQSHPACTIKASSCNQQFVSSAYMFASTILLFLAIALSSSMLVTLNPSYVLEVL